MVRRPGGRHRRFRAVEEIDVTRDARPADQLIQSHAAGERLAPSAITFELEKCEPGWRDFKRKAASMSCRYRNSG